MARKKKTIPKKLKVAEPWDKPAETGTAEAGKADAKPIGDTEMATTTKKKTTKKKSITTKSLRKLEGQSKSATVRAYAAKHPAASTQQIADALKLSYGTVYQATKKKSAKKKAKGRAAHGEKEGVGLRGGHEMNGKTASQLLHDAMAFGLDRTIALLAKVKEAIE